MKKSLLILTIIISSTIYSFSQCNQAANIFLDGEWTTFGEGWYQFTPQVNGTINLCQLGLVVEVYDDCFVGNAENPLSLIPTGEFCGSDFCGDQTTQILNVTAGNTVYFHFFIFGDPCGDGIDLRFLEEGNDCIMPTPITCGESVNFSTNFLSNKFNFQDLSFCGSPTINTTGQDKILLLSIPFPQDVFISMNSFKNDRDFLGVYQNCSDCISGCFLEACIGFSQESSGIDEVFIPGAVGNFYIIADWLPNNPADFEEGNNFVVSVSCGNPCGDPEILPCGMTINSTTINEVNSFGFNDYGSCNIGPFLYDGPDKVFQITKPSDQGNLMINLNIPLLSDLEVLLFDECGGSCLAVGQNTPGGKYIFDADPPLPAGDYFIVVDGEFDEFGFDFGLTVTCGDLDCTNAAELSCNVPLIGESSVNGNNNTSIYDCGINGIIPRCTGKEMVYTFTLTSTSDVTIDLENVANNADFDLMLLDNCDELTCIQSSSNGGLGISEQIIANQLPAGTYYVVVDGVYGSEGTYDITVDWSCCQDVVLNDCPFLFYDYIGPGGNGGLLYCFDIDYGMIDPEPVTSNSVTVDGDIVIPDTMSILQDFCVTFQTAGTYEVCYNTVAEDGCTTQCCIMAEVVDPSGSFQCIYGDNNLNTSRQVKWLDGAIYLASDNNATTNLNNDVPVFSKFDLSGNFVWGVELGVNGRINDFEITDNGDFLIVGRTPIVNNNNNESFIAKVDAAGNLLWTKTWFNEGREVLTAILKHPNPANPNFPFYLSGFQNPSDNSPSAVDAAVLYNINENGGINWKKEIDSEDDNQFARKMVLLPNGNFIIFGDNNIDGYFLEINPNGNVVATYTSGSDIVRIWAALALPSGEIIFSGRSSNSDAVITKVDANLNQIWGFQFPDQEEMMQLEMDGQNNIYAISSTSGGVNPVVTKINDAGATAMVEWIKTLDDQSLANANNAFFDVLNSGNIVYTDSRAVPNATFGQLDAFLALTDNALSSCFTVDLPINSANHSVIFQSTLAASVDDTVQDSTQNNNFTLWDPAQLCPCENCEADFLFTISPADCQTVGFLSVSDGYNLTYFWDFDNGNTSPLLDPIEVFDYGSYNVCLTVSNGVCMDTYCETIDVQPTGDFTVVCPPNQTLIADPQTCTATAMIENATVVGDFTCLDVTLFPCNRDGFVPLNDPYDIGVTTITCDAIDDLTGAESSCSYTITVTGTCCQDVVLNDCQSLLANYESTEPNGNIEYCFNIDSEMVDPGPIILNWVTVDGVTAPLDSMPGLENFCLTFPTTGTYEVCYNTLNEVGCTTQCCIMLEVVDPSDGFNCAYGDDQVNIPRRVKWRNGNVYLAAGNSAASNPNDTKPTFSKYDLNGNNLWGLELDFEGRISDFEQTDDGAFLLVGRTGFGDFNNQSFISKIDDNGNLLWTKKLSNPGRENIVRIIRHPNPVDPDYPYYLSGVQNSSNNATAVDIALIYNIDQDGNINWKRAMNGETDNQYVQDILPLGNGDFIMLGTIWNGNLNINESYFVELDGNGNFINAYGAGNNFLNMRAGSLLADGSIIFVGQFPGGEGGIVKVDASYNTVWTLRLDDQENIWRLDTDGQGNFYTIAGDANASTPFPVVTKINDLGASATVEWMKTLDDMELGNANNAYFDVLNTGNMVYADARDMPGYGFQEEDVFLALLDSDLTSCYTIDLPVNTSTEMIAFISTDNSADVSTLPPEADEMLFNPWQPMQDCPCDNCTALFSYTISPNDCQTINFTNLSSGYNITYSWDFGNSNTSTQENPVEVFGLGTYNVCLTVSNGVCMDTYCEVIEIGDDEPPIINCPPDTNLTANPGECIVDYTMPQPTAIDNCADPTLLIFTPTRDDRLAINDPWPVGTTCVTWEVVDEQGNINDCQSCVTVEYTLVCPPDQTLMADNSCQAILPNLTDSIALCNNSTFEGYVSHTLLIDDMGQLWAWGGNGAGTLGTGGGGSQSTPVQVGSDKDWDKLAIGQAAFNFSYAIKKDGSLWGWGNNTSGQLGLGNIPNRTTPTQIGSDTDWKQVSGGREFAIALKDNGTLWSTGANQFGQLGNGTTTSQNTFLQLGSDTDWKQVDAGFEFAAALKNDGTLWAWGKNQFGQLGQGNTTDSSVPVQIGNDNDWQTISLGNEFILALKNDGTLWGCGRNNNGQFGLGNITNYSSPVQLGIDNDWIDISAGSLQSLVVKADGTIWGAGYNFFGQLGLGNNQQSVLTFQQINATSSKGKVKAATRHTLLVDKASSSALYATGNNNFGQLGIGNTTDQNTLMPVQMSFQFSLLNQNPIPGTLLPLGCHDITITLSNGTTPIDSCVVEVCVEDLLPPVANCPPDINISVLAPTASVSVPFMATVSDNCPEATLSCDYSSGDDFPLGCTTVSCIATDASGLMDSCSFEICIDQDSLCNSCAPPLTLSDNLITNGDFSAGNTGFTSALQFGNGLALTSGSYDVHNSTTVANANANWICLDHTTGSTTGDFFVVDNPDVGDPPAWQSPQINVNPGEVYQLCFFANNLNDPQGVDFSDPEIGVRINGQVVQVPVPVSEVPDQWVRFDVLWTVPGGITTAVIDIYASSVTDLGADFALDDISFAQCGATTCISEFSWQPFENCGSVAFSEQAISPGTITTYNWTIDGILVSNSANFIYNFPASGTYEVCLEIADDQGCMDESCQDVTVSFEDSPPAIICLGTSPVLPTDPGTCEATNVEELPNLPSHSPCAQNINDFCVRDDGGDINDPYPLGVTTVTCYATDSFGTDSCSYTVTIEDQEPPVIFCEFYEFEVPPGECEYLFDIPNPQASDNCQSVDLLDFSWSRDDNQPLNAPWPIGITCVTWTVTDPSGNTDSCESCVVVSSTYEVICPEDIILVADMNCEAVVPDLFSEIVVIGCDSSNNSNLWQRVSAGNGHTIAIADDGTLWTWGRNHLGQLGDGTLTDSDVPVQISSDNDWQQISAGSLHNLALKTNGTLWAWGYNGFGQLGDGSMSNANNPQQLGSDNDWTKISAGGNHSLALKSNGSLWSCGDNTNGQLGRGAIAGSPNFQQAGTDNDWTEISAGGAHSLAIKSNGTLWATGENTVGQLGTGNNIASNVFVQAGTATNWNVIDAGGAHSLAIRSNGTLWAWGENGDGQLGLGTNVIHNTPQLVGQDTDWESISAGDINNLALKLSGTLWAWGSNSSGQLGTGNNNPQNTPTIVGVENGWQQMSVWGSNSAAIKNNTTLWTWGFNFFGQLGIGSTTNQNSPQPVITGIAISPIVAIQQTPAPGTIIGLGCQTINLVIQLENESTEICELEICVEDQTPPTINCPEDICHFP
jgi:alpha-tubulin suppressor-like RCC1 family protein